LKNESKRKNIIGFEEREQIWIPNLVFDNSIKDLQIKNDHFAILEINQNGTGILSFNKDNLKENLEFNGSSNNMMFSRSYKMSLICNFEQHNYPFDYQKCFIEVKISTNYTFLKLVFKGKMTVFFIIIVQIMIIIMIIQ
jgi:hypothetical protein